MRLILVLFLGLFLGLVLIPDTAQAYVGPGLGIGAIASVLGVIGGIFLAIFAVVYYPIKRVLRRRRTASVGAEAPAADGGIGADPGQ